MGKEFKKRNNVTEEFDLHEANEFKVLDSINKGAKPKAKVASGEKKNRNFIFRLTTEDLKKLKYVCSESEISMQKFFENAIKDYLEKGKQKILCEQYEKK